MPIAIQASSSVQTPHIVKYNNGRLLTDMTLCLIIVSGTASNKMQVS